MAGGGIPHDFLRNAAHGDAGAAEPMRLDHGSLRAIVGRTLCAGEPAAAATNAIRSKALMANSVDGRVRAHPPH